MHRNETWPTPAIAWGMKAGAIAGALHGFWIGGFSDVIRGEARFWASKKVILVFSVLGAFSGANGGGAAGLVYDNTVACALQLKKDALALTTPMMRKYACSPCDGLRFFKSHQPSNTTELQPEKITTKKV